MNVSSTREAKRIEKLLTRIVMAFDQASGAFHLQKLPGWDIAKEELEQALNEARDNVGDVSQLPCPLKWFSSVHNQARCWLEATPDVRRGLTPAVTLTVRTLSDFVTGKVAVAEVRGPIGGDR